MFNRILSFFMSLIILFGGVSLLFRPAVPKPVSAEELRKDAGILRHVELADKVYYVDAGRLSFSEWDTAMCLQGLVNREKAQLFISFGSIYRNYFEEVRKSGVQVVETDSEGTRWTLPLLIRELKDYIKDSGYVLYRNTELCEGLNTATNYSTMNGWLTIPEEMQQMAEDCGLVLKKDISKDEYTCEYLTDFFETYKDSFNKKGLVHQRRAGWGARDLAIQQGYFTTYTTMDKQSEKYLRKILRWTGGNAYLYGWAETEKHFVRLISKYGCSIIPADFSRDYSFLQAVNAEMPEQTGKGEPIQADPTKHYATILFSDGDNSQWVLNGFTEFYKKVQSFDNFPMTWTYPVIHQEIASACTRLAFRTAGEKNSFSAGASGSGYMNPSFFGIRYLDKFTTETAALMMQSNIDVVTILDDKPNLLSEMAFAQNFDYYSRFDNIRGGLVMLDPNRYESGKGKVWFSNGKPFVSVRLSLWYPGGEGETVTNEWIEEQAAKVNAFAKNPTSTEGYSLININPWSISVDNMAYFVSLLSEDVELVTANQLIDLISENVKH